jgi:hypothetical protein
MTEGDGLLTLLPAERTSQFSEDAAEAARISPLSARGPLIAHGLASKEGAAAYARAWVWVLHAEGLAESLRIRADLWWQRRLLGSVAACLFLESPRGEELAAGTLDALAAWSEFWLSYLHPRAISLAGAIGSPPTGDMRGILELEARLFTLGRELWRTHRLDAFGLFRSAWPMDLTFEEPLEALEALWSAFPDRRKDWEWRLMTPLEPPPPPPGPTTRPASSTTSGSSLPPVPSATRAPRSSRDAVEPAPRPASPLPPAG